MRGNRKFGRKKFFPEKVWKKQKFARGGLEKRIFPQEEVWKKENFCKSFLEGRILQEELWNKQFREKLQRFLQEGVLEEDSRILQKKKKKSSLKERNYADQLMKLWQQAKTFHCYVVVLTLECWNGSLNFFIFSCNGGL